MEHKKRRPKPQGRQNGLLINILTLIVLVLILFEGKSLISLFSRVSLQDRIREEELEVFASANLLEPETESETETEIPADSTSTSADTQSEAETEAESETEIDSRLIGLPANYENYMTAVVPVQAVSVDDSYFEDAVFIGDSRMEGFRNFSGITKGSFLTAVGMEVANIYTTPQIATAKGSVLVMDALENINFTKVYMMLGTNELGAYDMTTVIDSYKEVITEVKTYAASTEPIIYIYSVPYVEEALVTTGDYINNTNVDLMNELILQMCYEEGYHYINLNEIMSDGSHSLLSGASEDGVHLTQTYCNKWLEYTKTHYLPQV